MLADAFMKKGNPLSRGVTNLITIGILLSSLPVPLEAGEQADLEVSRIQSQATVPHGWRRTNQGWEHTSTWTLSNLTINQWIATQHDREPAWIRAGFSTLRSIPPLMVATLQIAAIAVITNIDKHRRKGEAQHAVPTA